MSGPTGIALVDWFLSNLVGFGGVGIGGVALWRNVRTERRLAAAGRPNVFATIKSDKDLKDWRILRIELTSRDSVGYALEEVAIVEPAQGRLRNLADGERRDDMGGIYLADPPEAGASRVLPGSLRVGPAGAVARNVYSGAMMSRDLHAEEFLLWLPPNSMSEASLSSRASTVRFAVTLRASNPDRTTTVIAVTASVATKA